MSYKEESTNDVMDGWHMHYINKSIGQNVRRKGSPSSSNAKPTEY